MHRERSKLKALLLILASLAIIVGIVRLVNIRADRSLIEHTVTPAEVPYLARLEGVYECIPFADPQAPASEECVRGIRTDAGLHYVIADVVLAPGTQAPQLVPGDRVMATGLVTPANQLNTDTWQKYPIAGIISVSDSFKKVSD